jgi:hypothetical protein
LKKYIKNNINYILKILIFLIKSVVLQSHLQINITLFFFSFFEKGNKKDGVKSSFVLLEMTWGRKAKDIGMYLFA